MLHFLLASHLNFHVYCVFNLARANTISNKIAVFLQGMRKPLKYLTPFYSCPVTVNFKSAK